jgi:hypothetical protein
VALVCASNLTLNGNCTIALGGTNYVNGQFPLISYTNTIGGSGFAALTTIVPPAGKTASLVNNTGNRTIDVLIATAAPVPPSPVIGPFNLSGGNLSLSVTSVLGFNYVPQSATNLPPAFWFNEAPTNAGTGGNLNWNIPVNPGQPQKYFRIQVY